MNNSSAEKERELQHTPSYPRAINIDTVVKKCEEHVGDIEAEK